MKKMQNEILNKVIAPTPPKVLYHYTTQQGLLGIVKDKRIFATHNQYLNDRREFVHAVNLFRDEIEHRRKKAYNVKSSVSEYLERVNEFLGLPFEGINVCVCSFSEKGDLLSQWRAYSAGGAGFSIGFSGEFLRTAVDSYEWYLARCVYRTNQQRRIISALADELIREHESGELAENMDDEEVEIHSRIGGNLSAYLNRYAPIFKDQSFEEEAEWRIISPPLFFGSDGFDYRTGRSVLTPYFKFALLDATGQLRIQEVIVGPTNDEMRAQRSVIGLLIQQGIPNAQFPSQLLVRNSKVPFRDW
jgi:hypothetical protein